MKPYIPIIAPKALELMGKIGPITPGNQTVLPFVISKKPMGPGSERHEVTHIWQQFEVAVAVSVLALLAAPVAPWTLWLVLWAWVPYLGPFYIIYGASWVVNKLRGMDGAEAYMRIIFELEAYGHDDDEAYLAQRKWFAWIREEQA